MRVRQTSFAAKRGALPDNCHQAADASSFSLCHRLARLAIADEDGADPAQIGTVWAPFADMKHRLGACATTLCTHRKHALVFASTTASKMGCDTGQSRSCGKYCIVVIKPHPILPDGHGRLPPLAGIPPGSSARARRDGLFCRRKKPAAAAARHRMSTHDASHDSGNHDSARITRGTVTAARVAPEHLPHLGGAMQSKWRVLLLNTKDSNPNYYIALSVEQALREHPAVEAVFNVDYHDAIATALKQNCNLLVALDGEGLDRGLCHRLAVLCGKSALWVSEDPYDRELNLRKAKLFDCVFTNDSASVRHDGGAAQHLPFAANPRFHEQTVPHDADERASLSLRRAVHRHGLA